MDDKAWQNFLSQLSAGTRRQLEPAEAEVEIQPPAWHLVIWRDGQRPRLQSFGELSRLRGALMAAWPRDNLLAGEVMLFVFYGLRAKTTKGREPYLLHPHGGELIPLFEQDPPLELCDDGIISSRDDLDVTEVEDPVFDDMLGLDADEEESPPDDEEPYPDLEGGDIDEEEPV